MFRVSKMPLSEIASPLLTFAVCESSSVDPYLHSTCIHCGQDISKIPYIVHSSQCSRFAKAVENTSRMGKGLVVFHDIIGRGIIAKVNRGTVLVTVDQGHSMLVSGADLRSDNSTWCTQPLNSSRHPTTAWPN